jgi:hypothetical protein
MPSLPCETTHLVLSEQGWVMGYMHDQLDGRYGYRSVEPVKRHRELPPWGAVLDVA